MSDSRNLETVEQSVLYSCLEKYDMPRKEGVNLSLGGERGKGKGRDAALTQEEALRSQRRTYHGIDIGGPLHHLCNLGLILSSSKDLFVGDRNRRWCAAEVVRDGANEVVEDDGGSGKM